MTSHRRFVLKDLFRYNDVNLDRWTETYDTSYYMSYLVKWPELCESVEGPQGRVAGYMIGKAEGTGEDWHGHVTAITVAPSYRRLGIASRLMHFLETASDTKKCMYVDLFVRASNDAAVLMYERLGYSKYRRVLGYYSGEEDAFDMRTALAADTERKSIVPLDPFEVDPSSLKFH